MNFDSYIVSETETAISVPLIASNNCKCFSLKRKAFTLAETLITLAIIGVIAAMTVPTLLSKYQKHTYVVGLKKAYSQLSNAIKMVPLTEGCPAGDYECSELFNNNIENRTKILAKQFKTTKEFFTRDNNDKGCENFVRGWAGNLDDDPYPCFYTADGMMWSAYSYDGDDSAIIFVDINGLQGPNKSGRDMFSFYIAKTTKNGIAQGTVIPGGSKLLETYAGWAFSECSSNNYGYQCTGKVLEEDAMNY